MRRLTFVFAGFFLFCFLLISSLVSSPAFSADSELWEEGKNGKPLIELNLPSFAPVIEKLGESVVNISVEGEETVHPLFQRPPDQLGRGGKDRPLSPFEFFFQLPKEQLGKNNKRSFSSLGSGFVLHPDGFIVTNNHVVEKATKIVVSFKDEKTTYDAKVIGRDKKTDLALIKVEPEKKLTAVVLGNSDELLPGDWVIAIGNPFRLGHTATVGIVSAKSRRIGDGPYDDFIQTDASINPGNSGGPLFNAKGEVVGVNTAIFSPNRFGSAGFNIGIGFATPMNIAKSVLSQLHKKGKVTRGWLGVLIQKVSPDMADALALKTASGALVADVMEESPAEKAGIYRGDVITAYDGKIVEENDDLPIMVANTPIGKKVKIDIVRGGKRRLVTVKIAELEEDSEEFAEETKEDSKLGLTVQEITPDIARSLDLDGDEGVMVSSVLEEGAAFRAGFRRGDIILEANGEAVNSVKEFRKATKGIKENKPMLFLVSRDENTIFLTIKLE